MQEFRVETKPAMQMGPRESKADLSSANVTWQNCYRGKETFTQVRNLQPHMTPPAKVCMGPLDAFILTEGMQGSLSFVQ